MKRDLRHERILQYMCLSPRDNQHTMITISASLMKLPSDNYEMSKVFKGRHETTTYSTTLIHPVSLSYVLDLKTGFDRQSITVYCQILFFALTDA